MSDTVPPKDTRAAVVEDAPESSGTATPAAAVDAPAAGTGAAPGLPSPAASEKEDENLSEAEIKAKVERLVAEGKKAVALKLWEEGTIKYGDALEAKRQLVGEYDISMAPLLYSYGRALYELTVSQQGVMGKEEVAKNTNPSGAQDAEAGPSSNPNFVFGGDGADDDEEDEEGGDDEGGEANPDDPEDDFNAAWDVLDMARTIYARELELPNLTEEQIKDTRLLLADCYLALADICLETENFEKAAADYTCAIQIQQELLPASSRTLAGSHYQLGNVLELTGGRGPALKHVQAALDGFKLRAAELAAVAAGKDGVSPDVARLSAKERDAEARDVAALLGDLEARIEELNEAPPAHDVVSASISHLLGGLGSDAPSAAADSAPVNDLTSMVRKKKKPTAAAPVPSNGADTSNSGEKRGAEGEGGSATKKSKTK